MAWRRMRMMKATPPVWIETSFNRTGLRRARRTAALGLLLFGWMLCGGTPGLSSQKTAIEQKKADVAAFSEKERETISALDQIDRELHTAKKRAAALRKDIAALKDGIDASQQAAAAIEADIARMRDYAAARLVALYKLNMLGKLNFLAAADSMFEFFQRKAILEKILSHDDAVLTTLTRRFQERDAVRTALKAQLQTQTALESELTGQIRQIRSQKEQREQVLQDIRDKKSLALAALEALRQSESALNETLSTLKKESAPAPAQGSQMSFTASKGLLMMPVKGKIIQFFGPYKNARFNIMNFRSGIDIRAERGEPVRAVYAGKTLYASWFKGYGNMIIIDHGHHYYTVYAHAEELFKQKGDRVEKGEVIATVGDSGSMMGPTLHFEVRHHGKPVDPLQWIQQG